MTLKEKFNSIDQSRITADQKAFLDKMKNVTKDFTLENKEVNDKVEGALDKMITSFKEKMPDAIKTSTKVVVPKTAKSKKTTKVVSKTTKPKRTVMSVAKEIRKEGESWKDAQKRASEIIKEDKADVSEVVKKELDRINKFINSRAELKGISGTNIKRDSVRTAKPRGVRTVTHSGETSNQYGTFSNKLGRRYWESRDRHADRLAPNYPKDAPLLADGGGVGRGIVLDKFKGQSPNNRHYSLEMFTNPDGLDYFRLYDDTSNEILAQSYDLEEVKLYAQMFKGKRYADGGYLTDPTFGNFQNQVYELGGTVVTDLAGHTGGTLGTGDPSLLSGNSGTAYTGLVGETGAMSSGEMFMNGGGLPSGSEQSYMITESLGSPAQHYAFGGGFREKNNRKYDIGRNWTNDHYQFDKNSEHEVEYRRRKKFELGGVMATDLAGHTGGTLGTGDPSLLSGNSGTAYTGLVGETGAMSSGEMFMNGGTLPSGVSQPYMITESLGNPAQHFAKGGGIPNNYEGKTPEQIWTMWTTNQRKHFLYDHQDEFPKKLQGFHNSKVLEKTEYSKLPEIIRLVLNMHKNGGQYKAGGMLDANQRYVLEIKGLTGLKKEAIESYIAENNLSDNDVLNIVVGLGRKQLKGTDVASAVVGKKGNSLSKKLIEFAKDNRAMKLEEGGNIDAFTLRMVKGSAGNPDEAMAEPRSVQFAEGGGVSQKEKRQEYLENLLILESEVWDKIGANSGGQIRQDEKLLRKYAEGVGSVMEKEGVGYGSFDEEDYEYLENENAHLFNDFLVWNNYYEPLLTKKEKAWRLKMYNDNVREKGKSIYTSNPEVITLNSTKRKSESDKKYIVNADIVSVTVKKGGKEVTYSGKDVLNGANILKDGGGIENKASYFSKNNIVSVKLKDGKTIKPANGYWVKKNATPIKKFDDGGEVTYFVNKDGIKVRSVAKPEKELSEAEWMAKHSESKEARGYAYGGGVDTFSEYSNDALYDMMINLSRYENTESEIQMIKDELERRKGGNLVIEEEVVYEKKGKKMATGGGVSKFEKLSDKVAKNYEGKRVKPQYQMEYGKVYSKEEAKEVGDKVAGKVKAMQKMNTGGEAKKGGKGAIMILAKQIRKDGEKWTDAVKRAGKQLK